MVVVNAGSFVNGRKQKIFTVSYAPEDAASVRGALFFMTGFGEYVGRYKEVFTRLVEDAHVVVYTFDHHGQGKSEPKEEKGRCYINEFDDLVVDAIQYLDTVLPKHPDVPWICAGHSLGGLVAVHVLLRRPKGLSGLVLHSAAIDVEWTPLLRFQALIGDCLAGCCPFAKMVPAVRPEDMNADPELIRQYMEDPDIYQGQVKARSANEILKGFKAAVKAQKQLAVPIYAAHGTKDKTTSLSAVKRLLKEAASTDKELKEFDGGYHEILFGPLKQDVIASLVTWVKSHTAGPGQGFA